MARKYPNADWLKSDTVEINFGYFYTVIVL